MVIPADLHSTAPPPTGSKTNTKGCLPPLLPTYLLFAARILGLVGLLDGPDASVARPQGPPVTCCAATRDTAGPESPGSRPLGILGSLDADLPTHTLHTRLSPTASCWPWKMSSHKPLVKASDGAGLPDETALSASDALSSPGADPTSPVPQRSPTLDDAQGKLTVAP